MPTKTYAFSGGVTAVAGTGQTDIVLYGGTWAVGDSWTINVVTSGGNFLLGAGNIAGKSIVCGLMLANRVYVGEGSNFRYSDPTTLDSNGLPTPTEWEIQGSGAGRNNVLTQFGSQNTVQAFASFQGRLAVFCADMIQMWTVNADPSQFDMVQPINNSGTIAKKSVVQIGDYDVLYLDTTGIRSLRWRETNLGAFVDDVGIAIDSVIQTALQGYDASGACATYEPSSGRYWLFLKDTIHVLSLFRGSEIQAWSTYLPTYDRSDVQTAFTPVKFEVYNRRVYCLSSLGDVFLYGGTNNNSYDAAIATVETSWMDHKSPAVVKQSNGIKPVFSGPWTFKCSMSPYDGDPSESVLATGSSVTPDSTKDSPVDKRIIPYRAHGTHIKIKAITSGSVRCVLSALVWLYQKGSAIG
jgi:hypothetical protein